MEYIVWWFKLTAQGMTPWVAYRFIRLMKISRTGFGFIDRRHPLIKKIKKAYMYLKLTTTGMNPIFAMRFVNVCMAPQMVFAERRKN